MELSDRVIVALDTSTVEQAHHLISRLGDRATHYKIGPALILNGGLKLARTLINKGVKVFLDMKLHDVPATVEAGAREAGALGCSFVTVHGYPPVMDAAMQGIGKYTRSQVLAVTVLTSMSENDLSTAGYGMDRDGLVVRRVLQACKSGVDGVVCAPTDLDVVEAVLSLNAPTGAGLIKVTPGIRYGENTDDHRNAGAPFYAFQHGAHYIVVGRPITHADDPLLEFERILAYARAGLDSLRRSLIDRTKR